jgi:Zn-dependent protease with chaperone function
MITGYVRKGERILFGVAFAFSLVVYGLIGLGLAAVVGSTRLHDGDTLEAYDEFDFGAEDNSGQFQEDETESFFEEESVEGKILAQLDDGFLGDEEFYGYEDDTEAYGYEMETAQASALGLMGTLGILVFYLAILIIVFVGAHIIAVGHLMGNGVRVSEKQFPELWAIFGRAALDLGIKKLPAFYLVESGGLLNAFATRLFTRSYVAIYADLAERLYEGDPDSVAFVVAHELVHVKRNHMLRNLVTLPAEIIPFLKPAWRRACEYSCDAGGAILAPAGARQGLALLAAGKRLSARLDVEAYLDSFNAEKSVWKRLAELVASHPHLPKRIAALGQRG